MTSPSHATCSDPSFQFMMTRASLSLWRVACGRSVGGTPGCCVSLRADLPFESLIVYRASKGLVKSVASHPWLRSNVAHDLDTPQLNCNSQTRLRAQKIQIPLFW